MEKRISKKEIGEVVRRVLTYYLRKKESQINEKKILFLIPSFPVGLQDMLQEYELYGELNSVDFLAEDEAVESFRDWNCQMYHASDKKDIVSVLGRLSTYDRLEIYDPSIAFLRELRSGNESRLFIKIAIFFLMSDKAVVVRMPYNMNPVSKGSFGKELNDLRSDLCDMGIAFSDLKVNPVVNRKLDLVTEEIVEEYYRRGEKVIYAEKDAVVTPLAWEKAKEQNMSIMK
ncbi:hypothetical protein [Faecalicatena contorta]|uniref:hypothetical protein n=1 Tax=Faecalicatena contorta TaxID=39482 RepID=UPI001F41EFA9|nr:hypothetical protein [Faecalicatena contorta]MCF2555414.1 hypothetical protein [Faecalicatena contorta]